MPKPIDEMTTEELSRIRVKHAAKTKKDDFAIFSLGQKKAITKVNYDHLSEEGRAFINDKKDKLTYPEEEDLF